MESDSDPEVIIVEDPAEGLGPPSSAPQRDIISISSSPDQSPAPMDIPGAENLTHNPLQYLPPPELENTPAPELRYPSELTADDPRPVPDISGINIGGPDEPDWPTFPLSEPTPLEHGGASANLRPYMRTKLLPPCLRTNQRSILGENLRNATVDNRVVKLIGLRELKEAGWTVKKEEEGIATLNLLQRYQKSVLKLNPPIKANNAPPDHNMGPEVSMGKKTVSRLVAPSAEFYNVSRSSKPFKARHARKQAAKPRAPTVKLEELEWNLD
ncbi:NmrA domain-containing protein [Ceratobasidium sp. AG-Ba]|nr:NmrA domain-containing protein [Ceratobasidium sp. AG-Ba]